MTEEILEEEMYAIAVDADGNIEIIQAVWQTHTTCVTIIIVEHLLMIQH